MDKAIEKQHYRQHCLVVLLRIWQMYHRVGRPVIIWFQLLGRFCFWKFVAKKYSSDYHNWIWLTAQASVHSPVLPASLHSVLAVLPGKNWSNSGIIPWCWQLTLFPPFNFFFSPRNSPTFKSFEEKVETTVTSLKVKVRGRVAWLCVLKCDSLVVPIICTGDWLNLLFYPEFHGSARALTENEGNMQRNCLSLLCC